MSRICRSGCRSRVITGADSVVNSSSGAAEPRAPGDVPAVAVLALPGDLDALLAGVLPEPRDPAGLGGRAGRVVGEFARSTPAAHRRTRISSRSTLTGGRSGEPLVRQPSGEPGGRVRRIRRLRCAAATTTTRAESAAGAIAAGRPPRTTFRRSRPPHGCRRRRPPPRPPRPCGPASFWAGPLRPRPMLRSIPSWDPLLLFCTLHDYNVTSAVTVAHDVFVPEG